MDKPAILKPTLIGGAVFGLLGAVPILNFINCACCALIMGAGFLASYLYSVECGKAGLAFRAGEGAKLGIVAGLFYAVVTSILQGLLAIAMGQPDLSQMLDQMESGGAPAEWIDMLEPVLEVMSGPMGVVIGFGFILILAVLFSTVGGLIGGAVFKLEAKPPSAGGI